MIIKIKKASLIWVSFKMNNVHANSIVRPCKFRPSMQIPSCIHTNEWQRKKTCNNFQPFLRKKFLNLRPMSFLHFSVRNLFAIDRLDFQPFVNGSNKTLKKTLKVAHTHAHTQTLQLRDRIGPVKIVNVWDGGWTC